MTARLREAMRETAERVTDRPEPYELYRGAVARMRRDRRRRLTAAAAAVVIAAVAGLAVPLWLHRIAPAPAEPPPAPPSLPARIGAPLWGTPPVTDERLGPASVAFGSGTWWWGESKGVTAVVGAGTDDYGIVENDDFLYAGEQAVLSPDGGRLAGSGRVTDLRTGAVTRLPDLRADPLVPQAWSPDGRWLAVIAYATHRQQADGTGVLMASAAGLHLVAPASGEHRKIGDLLPQGVTDGWTVAFAHDGRRLAYQSGQEITVTDLDGKVLSRFTAPAGARLAGKGAWTPDDRGLTLVSQRRCCQGEQYGSRWQLTVVAPADGSARTAPVLPELAGLVAVRLLGWSPSGEAVVAALYPEAGTAVLDFSTNQDTLASVHTRLTAYEWVSAARVLAVPASPTGATRVLVQGPDVLSIDVADDAIAGGRERPGHPPSGLGPNTRIVLGVAATGALVVLGGIVALGVLLLRRRGQPGAGWPPGRSPSNSAKSAR
ncbi:TolB family protein [Dactylosporangium sp. CA-233914]|uniref:TolB family protein n=1 Tax=Dactylosporangium sp. CA-233914 TaxID=3239934 RepID=UPI003D8D6536